MLTKDVTDRFDKLEALLQELIEHYRTEQKNKVIGLQDHDLIKNIDSRTY